MFKVQACSTPRTVAEFSFWLLHDSPLLVLSCLLSSRLVACRNDAQTDQHFQSKYSFYIKAAWISIFLYVKFIINIWAHRCARSLIRLVACPGQAVHRLISLFTEKTPPAEKFLPSIEFAGLIGTNISGLAGIWYAMKFASQDMNWGLLILMCPDADIHQH